LRRKARRTVRRAARKARRAVRAVRRVGRRRRRGFGNGGAPLRSLLTQETVLTAAGIVGSTFLTNLTMRQFGAFKIVDGAPVAKAPGEFKLPMSDTTLGALAYNIAIPLAGAWAATMLRLPPALAKGMIYGAAVNGVNALVGAASGAFSATRGTGAYLSNMELRAIPAMNSGMSASSVSGTGAVLSRFGTGFATGSNAFGASNRAFAQSAWH
jgi:hypothetical protein